MSARRLAHPDTLLIIEQDAHTAYLLDYMLSREGYAVIGTTSCESALHMMRRMLPPRAIFLDLELSCQNNYAMLRNVRSVPGWHLTPILLLTEQQGYARLDAALAAGATDYIIQPFNPAELLVQIQRHACRLQ
jgi:two-component system chemotaxis response regulator CheY